MFILAVAILMPKSYTSKYQSFANFHHSVIVKFFYTIVKFLYSLISPICPICPIVVSTKAR